MVSVTFVEAWVVTTTVHCSSTLTSTATLSPSTSPPPNVMMYSHWQVGTEDAKAGTSNFNCEKGIMQFINLWWESYITLLIANKSASAANILALNICQVFVPATYVFRSWICHYEVQSNISYKIDFTYLICLIWQLWQICLSCY